MSWEETEDAFVEAISRASGLPADRVIWKFQNKGAPDLDYIALSLGGAMQVGEDYVEETTDLTRARGQEIKLEVKGLREIPLEIEVFTAAVTREQAARAIAERTRSALLLPTISILLDRVSVSAFDTSGTVGWIPDLPAAKFRGRAVVTIRCYMPLADIIEYCGYIERVTGEMTIEGGRRGEVVIPFEAPPPVAPTPPPESYSSRVLARSPAHFWWLRGSGTAAESDLGSVGGFPIALNNVQGAGAIVPSEAQPSILCEGPGQWAQLDDFVFSDSAPFTLQIFEKPEILADDPGNLQNGLGWNGATEWGIDSGGLVHLQVAGDVNTEIVATDPIAAGELAMVTVTFDGARVVLYVKGLAQGFVATTTVRRDSGVFYVNPHSCDAFYSMLSYELQANDAATVMGDNRAGLGLT